MVDKENLAKAFPSQSQRILEEKGGHTYNFLYRLEALLAYGGKCIVCGCNLPGLLELRRMPGVPNMGKHSYNWLRQHNYPKGLVEVRCDEH